MLPAMRRDILLRAAATFQSEEWQKKAAPPMQAEAAMPQSHILFNFVAAAKLLEDVASLANDLKGETLPSIFPGGQVFVQRRAHGVMYAFVIRDCLVAGLIKVPDTRSSPGMLQFRLWFTPWLFPSSAATPW
jgi:hypothetical protein